MLHQTTTFPRPAASAAPGAGFLGRPHCPCGVPLTLFYCLPPVSDGAYRFTTRPPPAAVAAGDRVWAFSAAELHDFWNGSTDDPPPHAMWSEEPPDWYVWGACSPDLLRDQAAP